MKEVCRHPWFVEGLPQGAMQINKMLAQESRQAMPSDEAVEAIRAIIREAQGTAGQDARQEIGVQRHGLIGDVEARFAGLR